MNMVFTKIKNEIVDKYSYYIEYLKDYLSDEKIKHCVSTSGYAVYIARKKLIKVDENKIILAGILHDICREWKIEDIIKKAKEFNIKIDEHEKKYPVLLHGPVSAHLAMKELNIGDSDIYEAIYWHTTGKANLGLVGQILFLSDFSEPLRKYPKAAETRKVLEEQGFFNALFYSANERYLLSLKKRDPSPYSLEFINWLKTKRDLCIHAE